MTHTFENGLEEDENGKLLAVAYIVTKDDILSLAKTVKLDTEKLNKKKFGDNDAQSILCDLAELIDNGEEIGDLYTMIREYLLNEAGNE